MKRRRRTGPYATHCCRCGRPTRIDTPCVHCHTIQWPESEITHGPEWATDGTATKDPDEIEAFYNAQSDDAHKLMEAVADA